MVGATDMFYGEPGLVPRPQAGEQSYYLRGDGKWVPQDTRWEAALAVLYGVDPNTKSIREISHEEVLAIYGTNVPEAYNTVEKIAAWILRNGASLDGQNVAERLDILEKATLGEDKTSSTSGAIYAIDQLNQAVYGNKDIGIVGLIPKTNRLEGQVTDLEGTVTNILNKYNTLNTTVIDLDGRLTWKSML
jgi:hypothetical protein